MLEIDIFSDTICPWCFIGKRRLARALKERPQEGLIIRWRTFQLNPDMPDQGMDRQRYLETKFGGPENAESVYAPIKEVGAGEGIVFAFDAMKRTPNSIASHRLIRFAATHDCQDAVVEALFQAYFLRAEDIGDKDVLIAAAVEGGLDKDAAEKFLDGDEELDVVRGEDQQARHIGIQGVPFFIFNGKHALSGAQPPEVFFQLFDLINQEAREAAEP